MKRRRPPRATQNKDPIGLRLHLCKEDNQCYVICRGCWHRFCRNHRCSLPAQRARRGEGTLTTAFPPSRRTKRRSQAGAEDSVPRHCTRAGAQKKGSFKSVEASAFQENATDPRAVLAGPPALSQPNFKHPEPIPASPATNAYMLHAFLSVPYRSRRRPS